MEYKLHNQDTGFQENDLSKPKSPLKAPIVMVGQKKKSVGSIGRLAWIDQNQGIAIALAFALVLIYMAPIFLFCFLSWTTNHFVPVQSQFSVNLLQWFATFIHSSDLILNQIHKLLFPVMSAISIIFLQSRPTKGMIALGILILFSLGVTIYASVLFDIPSVQMAYKGLIDPPTIGSIKTNIELLQAHVGLVKGFFSRVQETLMMYFMMLIGISIANSNK